MGEVNLENDVTFQIYGPMTRGRKNDGSDGPNVYRICW